MNDTNSDADTTLPQVRVQAAGYADKAVARHIADRLGLELLGDDSEPHPGWHLRVDQSDWTLVRADGVGLTIDFTRGKADHRQQETGRIRQPLARALGMEAFRKKRGRLPHIIDATAGLGQDAWLMASLGCAVCMLERSSLLAAMLQHAIERAKTAAHTTNIARRLTLHNADSAIYLASQQQGAVDVIYLDPMYPKRRKQAHVKKGMQFLHELLPPDQDTSALLCSALQVAGSRVVVKRPKGSEPLHDQSSWSGQLTTVQSPNTRYDIYHIN